MMRQSDKYFVKRSTQPTAQTRFKVQAKPASDVADKLWKCLLCDFAYNEAEGLPNEGIPPGTRWVDVPESWICPECGATKAEFMMVQV